MPFIDLKRFEAGFEEAWLNKVAAMTADAQFIGGAEISKLEEALQLRLEVSYAISCANGTDALQLALRAIGVGRGDTVLVPNVTFWASFEAVVNVGATPVTVDADLDDGGIDLSAFEEAILTLRPKAAIMAHLYGWGSRHLEKIRALCANHQVLLLEDGAQCFGVKYKNSSIYKEAFISTTSFYPAKVLGAAGDGGAVFTNNAEIAARVRRLGNHGRASHYGYAEAGWNSRMDALQAAFINLSLNYLDARIESRQQTAAYYAQALPKLGIEGMKVPKDYVENGYCNVCLVPDPKRKLQLEQVLKENGIGFANIYPGVMSQQEGAQIYLKQHVGGATGERLCASILNLPLFPYMKNEELERVVSVIRSST